MFTLNNHMIVLLRKPHFFNHISFSFWKGRIRFISDVTQKVRLTVGQMPHLYLPSEKHLLHSWQLRCNGEGSKKRGGRFWNMWPNWETVGDASSYSNFCDFKCNTVQGTGTFIKELSHSNIFIGTLSLIAQKTRSDWICSGLRLWTRFSSGHLYGFICINSATQRETLL